MTTREEDLLGFNIVVVQEHNLRRRHQLNVELIPCRECDTGAGRIYTFTLENHRSIKSLHIESVHVDGSAYLFGPAVLKKP
jgi:hypothetical protein